MPAGGTCRDHFHAMLDLEGEIAGGPGTVAHFYAVASYVLQHPESMGLMAEAVEGMLAEVDSMLAGDIRIEDVRRHVRARTAKAGLVTRREGDDALRWPVGSDAWTMTVSDVLAGGVDAYGQRVERWAASIVATLRGRHA